MDEERVRQSYVTWEASKRALLAAEALLEDAMRAESVGGPTPFGLLAEVESLRNQTAMLFAEATAAVRSRGEIPGSGD